MVTALAEDSAFKYWRDDLLIRIPGCDPTVIESEFVGCLREFYKKSGAWIEELELTLRNGKQTYTVSPNGNNRKFLNVLHVKFGTTRPIRPTSSKPSLIPTLSGTSRFVPWMERPDRMWVFPKPADTLTMSVVVTGTCTFVDGKCHVPEARVIDNFYEPILDGTLGRLMMHVKKPWSSPKNATYHLRRFRAGIADARDEARRSWGMSESQFAFPQDWAGSGSGRVSGRRGY